MDREDEADVDQGTEAQGHTAAPSFKHVNGL